MTWMTQAAVFYTFL